MDEHQQHATEVHSEYYINNNSYENEINNSFESTQFKEYNVPLERNKSVKTENNSTRKWVAMTQNLPVDTITRHGDVPGKETKLIQTPKVEYAENMREKQKYTIQNENRIIEVPEVQFVDKIQYEPYVIEKLRYVPKEVVKYNVIKKPVVKNIINEKKVDVIKINEQIKFKEHEIVEEVYNHIDPYQNKRMDSEGNTINGDSRFEINEDLDAKFEKPRYQYIDDNNTLPPILEPFGNQIQLKEQPTIEQTFVPKVENVVEIKKKIDIPIDFPVPYIVPKPNIIDVNVPVFKFNNKYVPVPIRKKIIPKIKWSDKKYVVDCVIEKPYLVYHDIIKIIPTDSKIVVKEYPKGICKINPGSLSEQDNLAIWMRVNADLKKQKEKEKLNNGEEIASNYSCVCSEEEQELNSYSDINLSQECATTKSSNENIIETLPLHPGHPMAMVHLQNKWIKEDTTKTQDLYDKPYLQAHKNAVFNLGTNFPREAEIESSQIVAMQEQIAKAEFAKRYNDSYVN